MASMLADQAVLLEAALLTLILVRLLQKLNPKLDPEEFNGSKDPPGHKAEEDVVAIAQKYSQLWNKGNSPFVDIILQHDVPTTCVCTGVHEPCC